MRTVHDLLKAHGTPPPEVCFDWAWQLQEVLERLETEVTDPQALSTASAAVAASESLAWKNVQVDSSGVISFRTAPEPHDRSSLAALMKEAIAWTDCDLPHQSGTAEFDFQTIERPQLESLTQNWFETKGPIERRKKRSKVAQRKGDNSEATEVDFPSAGKLKTEALKTPERSASKADFANKRSKKRRSTLVYTFAASAGCLAVAGLFWMSGLFSNGQETGDGAVREVALAGADVRPPIFAESGGLAATDTGSDAQGDLVVLQEWEAESDDADFAAMDSLGEVADASLSQLSGPLNSDSSADSAVVDSESELSVEGQVASSNGVDVQAGGEPSGDDGTNETAALNDPNELTEAEDTAAKKAIAEAAELDVMEVMNEMAQESAGELLELEVGEEVQVEGDKQSQLPALQLATFPMLQIQNVPQVRKLRAREPAWELSLRVSDGFSVRPAKPLTLVAKEIVTWTVEESDPDDAKKSEPIQIVVRARLLGQRGERLQWSVAAEAADLPGVRLPVSQQYLDVVQQNLLGMQQQLRVAIQNLKRFSTLQGLPRGAKSAMSQQRRGFENQLELAGRVMEMAADANRLEGWLDGQFEVDAVFSDARQAPSTMLLQFGNSAPDAAAPDPTDADVD